MRQWTLALLLLFFVNECAEQEECTRSLQYRKFKVSCESEQRECLETRKNNIQNCNHTANECVKAIAGFPKICEQNVQEELMENNKRAQEKHVEERNSVYNKLRDAYIEIMKQVYPKYDGSVQHTDNVTHRIYKETLVNLTFSHIERIRSGDKKFINQSVPLVHYYGGIHNNLMSRLFDRVMIQIMWELSSLPEINQQWAKFWDCKEDNQWSTVDDCSTYLISNLTNLCHGQSTNQWNCDFYIDIIKSFAELKNITHYKNLERPTIMYRKTRTNSEGVDLQNVVVLLNISDYEKIYIDCYSVKRSVSSCYVNHEVSGSDLGECLDSIESTQECKKALERDQGLSLWVPVVIIVVIVLSVVISIRYDKYKRAQAQAQAQAAAQAAAQAQAEAEAAAQAAAAQAEAENQANDKADKELNEIKIATPSTEEAGSGNNSNPRKQSSSSATSGREFIRSQEEPLIASDPQPEQTLKPSP